MFQWSLICHLPAVDSNASTSERISSVFLGNLRIGLELEIDKDDGCSRSSSPISVQLEV
jgi:hypothetical protein